LLSKIPLLFFLSRCFRKKFIKLFSIIILLLILMLPINHSLMYAFGIAISKTLSFRTENQITPIQTSSIYSKILFISERVAANLIINAVPERDGYKWPIQFGNMYFNPGFHSGAAGVGTFLLSLYIATWNTTYLKYAEGAAKWIIYMAKKNPDDSVTWCSYDDEKCWFLTPDKDVSGIIKFFLRLYNITGNNIYLEYAEKGAKWIINNALVKDHQGVYVLYNPLRQAAFGVYSYVQRDVGTLMIDLYIATKNTKYLDVAKSIGEWILFTSECDQYLCKWYDDRGYGNIYTIEGASPIADLLYELYKVTGDHKYLQVAEKIVNWIERQGKRIDNYRIKFPNYKGKYLTVIDGYWDRPFFPMTPADIFVKSYLFTKNVSRLNVAKSYANWLISLSSIEDDQARVPFSEEQRIYHAWINARIFNFIILLYHQTKELVYLDFASKLLNYILSTAVEDRGFKWPRLDGKVWITFGLGEGSCAIGYYLLSSLSFMSIVSPAEYRVELDSSPRVGSVEVNGVGLSLPYLGWFKEGDTINITVQSVIFIDSSPKTRRAYVFSGWSDGTMTPTRSIKVDKPLSLVAVYQLTVMHFVEVTANIQEAEKSIAGSGWYKEGEKAKVSAEPVIPVSDNVRLVFVEWAGLSSRSIEEVLVDSPKELKAIYKRQYRVTVIKPEITASDLTVNTIIFEDYLMENSLLDLLPDITVIPLIIADRFVGYEEESGRFLGRHVIVDRPLRLIARYQRDYTGLFVLIALSVAVGVIFFVYKEGWLKRKTVEAVVAGTAADTEEFKRELEVVEGKVREYREYLLKLELLHQEGKVTDEVYQELKNIYSRELEKYENELKKRLAKEDWRNLKYKNFNG
ncbi:MAG: hypothetical protein QXM43_05945, partial [Desulfurococcaceae archaeon]